MSRGPSVGLPFISLFDSVDAFRESLWREKKDEEGRESICVHRKLQFVILLKIGPTTRIDNRNWSSVWENGVESSKFPEWQSYLQLPLFPVDIPKCHRINGYKASKEEKMSRPEHIPRFLPGIRPSGEEREDAHGTNIIRNFEIKMSLMEELPRKLLYIHKNLRKHTSAITIYYHQLNVVQKL